MAQPHDPADTYLYLGSGPEVRLLPVTADFWPTIDQRTDLTGGRLVTGLTMDADWDTWEMHPAGDELIVVTEGTVRFHLDDDASVSQVTVTAPNYVVVPAGVWHTADASGGARLLVITWGDGTQHRPR